MTKEQAGITYKYDAWNRMVSAFLTGLLKLSQKEPRSVLAPMRDCDVRIPITGVLTVDGRDTGKASARATQKAAGVFTSAPKLPPEDPAAWNRSGIAKEQRGDLVGAIACYRDSIRHGLGFFPAWTNLAHALQTLGAAEEALRACDEAIRLQPQYAPAHNVLGGILCELRRLNEACTAFREAVRLQPGLAEAHANLGRGLLSRGDFEKGWVEHEWRRRIAESQYQPGMPWLGSDLFGHTILLYGEGGFGNVIQFSRYAPVVAQMGARVVVQCHERLLPLLRTVAGVWQVIPEGQEVEACELHCPLMSVPAVLRTDLDNVPAQVPYLVPEGRRLEKWGRELSGLPGFKIGIAWEAEQGTVYGRQRSIPLDYYAILSRIPGVHLISLHRDWKGPANFPITVLPELDKQGGAFLDTAAVIPDLDLVITCDTSIAHLAGALAAPVWVAERFAPDWRWMLDREDSPWYPTLRLFRQQTSGDWKSVFERMANELRKKLS